MNALDRESAWRELSMFAAAAGIELDARAAPDYEAPKNPTDQSEVSDYDGLLHGLETGHLTVESNGMLELVWKRAPHDRTTMKLDPGDWAYSMAILAYSGQILCGAKNKSRSCGPEASNVAKVHAFLEVLGDEPGGTCASLRSRADVHLIAQLGAFLLSE